MLLATQAQAHLLTFPHGRTPAIPPVRERNPICPRGPLSFFQLLAGGLQYSLCCRCLPPISALGALSARQGTGLALATLPWREGSFWAWPLWAGCPLPASWCLLPLASV